jgi:hypothetical protein
LTPKACAATQDYDWKAVHADLENGLYAGSYGWDNAAYWGIAEQKAGIDLKEWYKTRTEAEFYLPEFKDLIDHPETQQEWKNIVTFDPMGMYSHLTRQPLLHARPESTFPSCRIWNVMVKSCCLQEKL